MSFNFTDLRDKLNKEAVIDRSVTTKSIEDLCRVTDLCKNDIIRGLADIIEKQNILLNNTLAGQGYIMNEIYDTGDSTASGFSTEDHDNETKEISEEPVKNMVAKLKEESSEQDSYDSLLAEYILFYADNNMGFSKDSRKKFANSANSMGIHIKDIADIMGLTEKTIHNYLKD